MTTKEIWVLHAGDIKNFVLSKVKDEATADDIVQDTFLKIHTKLHTLKDISKLKSWVFSIARNSIIDHFKNSKKTFDFIGFELETKEFENIHSEKDCLRGILKNLPKKYRDPLFLADIKGIKQQEIAQQLKLPLPTVKSQIQRARKLIAKGFMDCCGFIMNDQGKLVGEIQEKEDCKVCN